MQASSGSTSSTGGAISVGTPQRSAFGDLMMLGVMLGVVYGSEGFGTRYSSNPFMAIRSTPPAPELDATRAVHEQDCTRPIENGSANLRCR